jgi:hypothetical protein
VFPVWELQQSRLASEQEREDVRMLREQWLREILLLNPEKIVFIDESGAKPNMIRLRGRSPAPGCLLLLRTATGTQQP